jgi:ferric-dicitrate binding protein FerR (iron transport regulator)
VSWTDYAAQAARVLREIGARIVPGHRSAPAPTVERLAKVIRRTAGRRRRRRVTFAAVTATLWAVAIVVGLRLHARAPSPPVSLVSAPVFARPSFVAVGSRTASLIGPGGNRRALLPGEVWHPGDRLQSPSESAELRTADGSALSLSAGSELQLIRADRERWLRLAAGTVTIHVAKLQAGERFVIVTPDTEVEVRGTRFQVQVHEVPDGCGRLTGVQVEEGVVAVRAAGVDSQIYAGGHWPEACPDPAAAVVPPAPRARMHAPGRHLSAPAVHPAMAATPPSTLDTENDLFSSALRAERRGNRRQAVELLDLLLNRFPTTPLRASALEARARIGRAPPP